MVSTLIPSVDKRIAAWQEFKSRQADYKPQKKKSFTITLSREFGCEGYPLAEALKSSLEAQTSEVWTIFDELLLDKIQEDHKISKNLLKGFGEQSSFMDSLVAMLVPDWKTEKSAFQFIAESIYNIAKEGNAIIVGRGGAVIAQELPRCYHFRLNAPLDFRIESISKRMNLSVADAGENIEKYQKKRDEFINRFLKNDLSDCNHYHAVFNNALSTVDLIADTIVRYVELSLKTK